MDRLSRFVFRRRSGTLMPAFWLPLNDSGAGAVNTTPGVALGSKTATFTRATTAMTILSTGLLASVASGTARSCYSPAGVYLGYLAEQQSTNLCLRSSSYTAAEWTKNATTVGGVVIGPDGNLAVTNKIREDATTTVHYVAQAIAKAASALVYTFSVWLQAGERGFAYLQLSDGAGNTATASWNLSTGAIVSAAAVVGTFTGASATAGVAYPNGWFRVTLTATSNTAVSIVPLIAPSVTGSDAFNYAGTAGSGIFAWGAQLEQLAFATSHIPTDPAAVTRNADSLSYVLASNLSNSEGTAYAEVMADVGAAGTTRILIGGVGGNNAAMRLNTDNKLYVWDAGGTEANIAFTAGPTSQKCASRWSVSGNNTDVFVGGVKGTSSVANAAGLGLTLLAVGMTASGTAVANAAFKNIKVWTRPLVDAQMGSLTS